MDKQKNSPLKLPSKHNCIYTDDVLKALWSGENLPECKEVGKTVEIICVKNDNVAVGQCSKMETNGIMYYNNGIHRVKTVNEIDIPQNKVVNTLPTNKTPPTNKNNQNKKIII